MALALSVLGVFLLLLVSEFWWRRHSQHSEASRKFVHITVGSFVAFWPFFLSWHQIELLSLAFLVVVGLSKYLGIFRAIHSVQRPTWGEVFFAIAVGAIALVTQEKWVYTAALLQMSLADGLAAIIGLRYGRNRQYDILGSTKSIVGTLTFFVVSILILVGYTHYGQTTIAAANLIVLAAAASLVENLGAYGLDNLLVPLLIALSLNH